MDFSDRECLWLWHGNRIRSEASDGFMCNKTADSLQSKRIG